MKNLEPRRARWVRVRIALLSMLMLTGVVAVVLRAYELQVKRASALRELAEQQYFRSIRLAPKRGTVYDRHGAELAVSVETDSVWANPRTMRRAGADPGSVARRLAEVLGVDTSVLVQRFSGTRYFVWVKRQVTPQQAAKVRAMKLPGIGLSREAKRFYPNRELAAHVLGFANVDGVGIEGLELSFERELRGSAGAVPAIFDRRGAVVFSEQLLDDRATRGDDLVLTLDKTLQHLAEQELTMAVRTFEARAGSIVAMDPTTGELLAVANYPTFNPNDPKSAEPADRRNRAVTDRFEPGSTIKPFTVAGALSAGTVSPTQRIDCQHGAMQIDEYTIHDSMPWDMLTPAQVLSRSSNIGAAKIGGTLGRAGLFRVLRRFGFGERTGVPLPGETEGILRHYRRWYEMDAATISFGQGMSVTATQLAVAMAAVANGGLLMKPLLVKRVVNGRGDVEREFLPEARRQVVSNRVARMVSDMLTAVTGPDGTGVEAAIDGYLVAGKTGTAQKADYLSGGYAADRWIASFAGFLPAERPRLVIAVVIDEPVIAHYGGTVAGSVFRRIGAAAMRHMGVAPSGGNTALALMKTDRAQEGAPAVQAASPDETHNGVGDPSVSQDQADGAVTSGVRVPSLVGLTARVALKDVRRANLMVALTGSGVVATQSPGAGSRAAPGTVVRLRLEKPAPSPTIAESNGDSDDAHALPDAKMASATNAMPRGRVGR